jgi:hypothetical protein
VIALRSSVCIDALATEVWGHLARLEDIRLWSEAIDDARHAMASTMAWAQSGRAD